MRAVCKRAHEVNYEKYRAARRIAYANRGRAQNFKVRAARYGISEQELFDLLAKGKCEICGLEEPTGNGWQVDHCHTTGVVRGLLCTQCNLMLGHSKDDPKILKAGAQYLRLKGETNELQRRTE